MTITCQKNRRPRKTLISSIARTYERVVSPREARKTGCKDFYLVIRPRIEQPLSRLHLIDIVYQNALLVASYDTHWIRLAYSFVVRTSWAKYIAAFFFHLVISLFADRASTHCCLGLISFQLLLLFIYLLAIFLYSILTFISLFFLIRFFLSCYSCFF